VLGVELTRCPSQFSITHEGLAEGYRDRVLGVEADALPQSQFSINHEDQQDFLYTLHPTPYPLSPYHLKEKSRPRNASGFPVNCWD
jgi:hypothetical protein